VNNQNALLRMYIYLLSSLNMNTQNKWYHLQSIHKKIKVLRSLIKYLRRN
jgi:hypothetical protein